MHNPLKNLLASVLHTMYSSLFEIPVRFHSAAALPLESPSAPALPSQSFPCLSCHMDHVAQEGGVSTRQQV